MEIKKMYKRPNLKKTYEGKVKPFKMGLRKKLCKQYLTTLDKAKITGISLI